MKMNKRVYIKNARLKKGLTMKQLSELLNKQLADGQKVNKQWVIDIEDGRINSISLERKKALKETLAPYLNKGVRIKEKEVFNKNRKLEQPKPDVLIPKRYLLVHVFRDGKFIGQFIQSTSPDVNILFGHIVRLDPKTRRNINVSHLFERTVGQQISGPSLTEGYDSDVDLRVMQVFSV